MDPNTPTTNTPQPEAQKSSKSTLLTLASLLFLVGIIGITLYLYIQNKSNQKNNSNTKNSIVAITPTNTPKDLKLDPEVNALCGNPREYTSLTDALGEQNYNEICILNLKAPDSSFQFPSDITKKKLFSKLVILKLSGYDLSNFPQDLAKLPNLTHLSLTNSKIVYFFIDPNTLNKLKTLDLSDNKLTKLPNAIGSLSSLKKLILKGNNISATEKENIRALLKNTEIVF